MLRTFTLLCAAWVLLLASQTAHAQYRPGKAVAQAKPAKEKAPPSVPFVVVQVDSDYTPVKKTDVKQFEKSILDQYKEDLKTYNEEKKAAAKEKRKFDQPKPVKKKVKVHSTVFKTEEEASEYIEKQVKEAEKTKSKP